MTTLRTPSFIAASMTLYVLITLVAKVVLSGSISTRGIAAKCTTASGGRGGWPRVKPAKVGCVVSALKAWPLSVRSAIRVGTPGKSSGFKSTLSTE